MGTLVTHHFFFTTRVVRPLELDEHSGAALRGNLFEAVWQRFCTNKEARSCAECPIHHLCPVSALVAPLREENKRGCDIPRPYIILPPLEGARCFAPGESLAFGLTLFGKIIELLPYLLLVTNSLEAAGLGRRLAENNGRRGTFQIQQIEAYHIDGTRQVISQAGKLRIEAPTLSVNATDIKKRAATFSDEQISIRFLTPTRLMQNKRPVYQPVFQTLIARLLERLMLLEQEYGEVEGQSPSVRWEELNQLAAQVVCVEDCTSWMDVRSHSRRTDRTTDIGGFCGAATFAGDLTPFHELLAWGEQIHVGQNVVKGCGWYRVEA